MKPPRSKRPLLNPKQAKLAKAFIATGSVTEAAAVAGYTRPGASKALSRPEFRARIGEALRRRGIDEDSLADQVLGLLEDPSDEERDAEGVIVKKVRRGAVLARAIQLAHGFLQPEYGPPKDEDAAPFYSPVAVHGFDRVQRLAFALLAMGDPDNPAAAAVARYAGTDVDGDARAVDAELVAVETEDAS